MEQRDQRRDGARVDHTNGRSLVGFGEHPQRLGGAPLGAVRVAVWVEEADELLGDLGLVVGIANGEVAERTRRKGDGVWRAVIEYLHEGSDASRLGDGDLVGRVAVGEVAQRRRRPRLAGGAAVAR